VVEELFADSPVGDRSAAGESRVVDLVVVDGARGAAFMVWHVVQWSSSSACGVS
jgi:hypothetical protein